MKRVKRWHELRTVCWNFNKSATNEFTLQPLCQRVDKCFQLSTDKLYRYFAVVDDEYLSEKIGQYYRGIRFPTSGTDEVCRYAQNLCLPPGSTKNYDHLIYIRHSTCLDPTGCVITYAHELQHVAQEDRFPKLMKVNSIFYANLRTFEPSATEIDIPSEAEANIVSKRVAEIVCGVDAVRKFAEEQLGRMNAAGAATQIVRWKFFLDTPSSIAFDYVEPTIDLVKKYKGRMSFGMDVDEPGWWHGPLLENDLGTY